MAWERLAHAVQQVVLQQARLAAGSTMSASRPRGRGDCTSGPGYHLALYMVMRRQRRCVPWRASASSGACALLLLDRARRRSIHAPTSLAAAAHLPQLLQPLHESQGVVILLVEHDSELVHPARSVLAPLSISWLQVLQLGS